MERSLRHVAMVAKFLDDNKVNSHCFKLYRSYSIYFNLSNVGKPLWGWGVESESTISKFRKRKRKFLCCVHLPYTITRTREIRKFHVAGVQRRLRHVQKSVINVESCCFANISRLLICCSRCRFCCFISILLWSRNFAIMVTDVTLFFPTGEQNNETAAMLVYRKSLVGSELISHVKGFFCFKKFAKLLNTFLM